MPKLEPEKFTLESGDAIRLTYKGHGTFGIQIDHKAGGATLLRGAGTFPIEDLADYLKAKF